MSGRGREPRTKAGRELRDIIETIPWHPVPRNAAALIRAVEREAAAIPASPEDGCLDCATNPGCCDTHDIS